ncbi:hypothetical protein BC828DRAFT_377511 [Blastocladiella britannica]|nr:hypothetical protein BC828DRAFT_377511 [Blastocladiella britannica]
MRSRPLSVSEVRRHQPLPLDWLPPRCSPSPTLACAIGDIYIYPYFRGACLAQPQHSPMQLSQLRLTTSKNPNSKAPRQKKTDTAVHHAIATLNAVPVGTHDPLPIRFTGIVSIVRPNLMAARGATLVQVTQPQRADGVGAGGSDCNAVNVFVFGTAKKPTSVPPASTASRPSAALIETISAGPVARKSVATQEDEEGESKDVSLPMEEDEEELVAPAKSECALKVGDIVTVVLPWRLRATSVGALPGFRVKATSVHVLGSAVDAHNCTAPSCRAYVLLPPSAQDYGFKDCLTNLRCDVHVLEQVHRALSSRQELSGSNTAPMHVTGSGSSTAQVQSFGGGTGSSQRQGRDTDVVGYFLGRAVVYTRDMAAAANTKQGGTSEARKRAIETILATCDSPGAQYLRHSRNMDPKMRLGKSFVTFSFFAIFVLTPSIHATETAQSTYQRRLTKQRESHVTKSLSILSDARKEREVARVKLQHEKRILAARKPDPVVAEPVPAMIELTDSDSE